MQASVLPASRRATAHEILNSLWDLEYLHREMIEQMRRLLDTLEDEPPPIPDV